MSDDARPVEDTLRDWLGLDTPPRTRTRPPADKAARVDKRKREVARLEARLEADATRLAATLRALKRARRSLAALKRSARKGARRA